MTTTGQHYRSKHRINIDPPPSSLPIPIPTVGQTTPFEFAPGQIATIERQGERVFYVTFPDGHHKTIAPQTRTTRAETLWVSAQNALRGEIGLPRLPLPCAWCGCAYNKKEGVGRYCSHAHAALGHRQNARRTSPADDNLPPVSEILATLNAIWEAKHKGDQDSEGDFVPQGMKQWGGNGTLFTGELSLRAARQQADQLILRRGGKIPKGGHGYCRSPEVSPPALTPVPVPVPVPVPTLTPTPSLAPPPPAADDPPAQPDP